MTSWLSRSAGTFGCARLIRLLDELVDPRLEHLAELLVEGIAEGAAGAGGAGRLRGGVRAGVGGRGRRRGGRRTASARGAFPAHRGVGAAAALARRRLLTNAAGARGLRGAGLGFRLRLSALARGAGARLLLVALRARPGGRLGLGGLVPPPVALPAIIVARAPAGSGLERGLRLLQEIGRKKNASAGPGLPTVAARVAAKTSAAPWIERMGMWKLPFGMNELLSRNTGRCAPL